MPGDGFVDGAVKAAANFAGVGATVEEFRNNASQFVEDGVSDAKRRMKRGQEAFEDKLEETAHMIRHEPLRSVGITFGVGFGLGAIVGLLLAYQSRATKVVITKEA